jgi:hypothetical protein
VYRSFGIGEGGGRWLVLNAMRPCDRRADAVGPARSAVPPRAGTGRLIISLPKCRLCCVERPVEDPADELHMANNSPAGSNPDRYL